MAATKKKYIGRVADIHTRIKTTIRHLEKIEACEETEDVKRLLYFASEELRKYLARVKFEYEKTRVEKCLKNGNRNNFNGKECLHNE